MSADNQIGFSNVTSIMKRRGAEPAAMLHRRMLEISAHRVSRDICARLNSQKVRFQFRTVLAPGRSDHSIAAPELLASA